MYINAPKKEIIVKSNKNSNVAKIFLNGSYGM